MGKGLSGTVFFFLGVLAFSFGVSAPAASEVSCPPVSSSEQQVSTPPSTYNPFYKKWLDANGIDIVGSDQVCDRTLQVAAEIVREMLIERPDIRENLITQHHFVAVFAVSEKMTDLPEDQDLKGIAIDPTRTYDTVCGGGGGDGEAYYSLRTQFDWSE